MGNLTQPDPTVPRAYLKYIHYDQDSQFVSMGIVPITSEAGSSYEALILQLVAQEDGFVQFFVANETLRDVYFDDISGMVRRPKIIQEGHYNPFGLPLAGLTTLGNPEYAYFFTGKELCEDEALQWYDYGARMYDVQIGRWTTHDPLYQDASPYVYCGNNPVMRIDPTGMNWFEDFGRWVDKNQKEIVQGVFIGVSVGLAFTPIGLAAGIGVSMGLGGIQGALFGGGLDGAMKGMIIGGLSAGFGAGAGLAVAKGLGKEAAATFGGTLLTAAAGGFAGGFVGGAINAAENGGDIWKGALLGGAIGAGSAMAMAAGVYGVKQLGTEIAFRRTLKKSLISDGNYENATMAEKREFINNSQKKQLANLKKKVSLYTEDTPEDQLPKYEKTKNSVKFNGNKVIDANGGENLGLTVNENYSDQIDIYINTKGHDSYRELFVTARHEGQHAFYFNKNIPAGLHHLFFKNGYDNKQSNFYAKYHNSPDFLFFR